MQWRLLVNCLTLNLKFNDNIFWRNGNKLKIKDQCSTDTLTEYSHQEYPIAMKGQKRSSIGSDAHTEKPVGVV